MTVPRLALFALSGVAAFLAAVAVWAWFEAWHGRIRWE